MTPLRDDCYCGFGHIGRIVCSELYDDKISFVIIEQEPAVIEHIEAKLFRAGATRVVSPYLIGGKRMAQMLKKPTVVDFIDCAMMGSHLDLMMEEAAIGDKSSLIGKSLIDSNLRRDYGVIIVAIKKLNGDMIFNPLPSQTREAGDVIVIIGKKEDLKRMNTVL